MLLQTQEPWDFCSSVVNDHTGNPAIGQPSTLTPQKDTIIRDKDGVGSHVHHFADIGDRSRAYAQPMHHGPALAHKNQGLLIERLHALSNLASQLPRGHFRYLYDAMVAIACDHWPQIQMGHPAIDDPLALDDIPHVMASVHYHTCFVKECLLGKGWLRGQQILVVIHMRIEGRLMRHKEIAAARVCLPQRGQRGLPGYGDALHRRLWITVLETIARSIVPCDPRPQRSHMQIEISGDHLIYPFAASCDAALWFQP
jgi:hypothetical protein